MQSGNPLPSNVVSSYMSTPSRPASTAGSIPEHVTEQEFETLLMETLDAAYRLALRLTGDR